MDHARLRIQELYRQSRRAAFWGVAIGCGLGLAKLAGGWFGHSIALVSDSIHSLGDALMSLVVWLALRWSQAPADPEHPYGHTRGEAVAGSNIATVLMLSALGIFWESLRTLGEPAPEPENYTVWIAGVSVFIKEALFQYNHHVAKKTGSSAIRATAWDHRMDALGSLAVLVGLLIVKWGGAPFYAADHIAAAIVGVAILWTGGNLFWTSLQELLDRQADPAIVQGVRQEALVIPGVQNIEKLLVRKTGLEYLVDIHVEVDPNMTVRQSHDIAHAVKDRVIDRVVPVKDVLVHIEPAGDKGRRI